MAGAFADVHCSIAARNKEAEDWLPADLTNLFSPFAPKATETPPPCRIKNTFLEFGEDLAGELEDVELHDSGAQTWAASDVRSACQLQPENPLTAKVLEEDCSNPLDLLTVPSQAEKSSDMRGHCESHHVAAQTSPVRTSPASALPPHQPKDADAATLNPPSFAPDESRLVVLQVPLRLQGANIALLGCKNMDTSVIVEEQEIDAETDAVSLQLKVLLMPPTINAETLPKSLSLQQLLSPSLASATLKRPRQTTPGEAAAKTRDMVCCHWKNKGWCRYGNDCKFMHPVDKCGLSAEPPNLSTGAVSGPVLSRRKHVRLADGTPPLLPSRTSSHVPTLQVPLPMHVQPYLYAWMPTAEQQGPSQ
jgi:hypothetical protein